MRGMSNVIITPEFLNLESPYLAKAILEHTIATAKTFSEDMQGHRPVMRFEIVCYPWMMKRLAACRTASEDPVAEPDEAA